PPHESGPPVPVSIERAILKCLEKEPPKRYQSVTDLEAALRAPGAPPMAPTLAAIAPHYSSHAAISSQLLHPSADAPKRTSPVASVLLGALLIIGGFAGWHSMQVMQSAEQLPPPASLPAPVPPDFALDATAAQPADVQPAAAAAAPVEEESAAD